MDGTEEAAAPSPSESKDEVHVSAPDAGASSIPSHVPAKSSPTRKHGNLLTLDPNESLAAISARLAIVIPPAESEIARINREALLAASRRKPQNGASDAHAKQNNEDEGESEYSPEELAAMVGKESPNKSPNSKTSIAPALHESIIAEEWVNVHLETTSEYLLPATDIQALLKKVEMAAGSNSDDMLSEQDLLALRHSGPIGPLARAGIDRTSLYRLGMPKDLVDRLYRALYVYTNGFHNIISEIASHCPPPVEKHISSNVWLTFLLLLEQCEDGKYEMAMLKFKQATQEWRRKKQEEFTNEKARLEAQLHILETNLFLETSRSAEKSDLIAKLATDGHTANITISDQQREIAALAEKIRLLKLENLVHEDNEKKLNEQLDDVRKDYEVANSERFNALAERYTFEEQIRKLQTDLERVEVEKANYAKRMHETLFMNQALRASNETMKQHAVVVKMEKEKILAEKQSLQSQLDLSLQDIQDMKAFNAQVEKDLLESQRKNEHVEERLQTMKEQFNLEVENTTRQLKEVALLTTQIDEERVKIGVLEAKCNLLTAEKQNTGMRAQDKLRIERLLNQKLDLENQVEAMKSDRAKDQEQIWNLRASLEALDTEMQHSKRVFSAGQQAFLHSERACEQLRHQLQEIEKNYEKSSKNLASLRERFKLFEESSKDQVTKLEVELKVTSAQLREVSYANRDNTALIGELNKSLEISGKEVKNLKSRIDASDQQFTQLKSEKEELQREKLQRELQHSTSRQEIHNYIRALQHLLALVKLDEFPLDEALRELLRLTLETFGNDLQISKVLEEEDEPRDFEEVYDEGEEYFDFPPGARRGRRPAQSEFVNEEDNGENESEFTDENGDRQQRVQITRMSPFRKSKLDKLVKKLQRELELKGELVQSLEGVICSQADELNQLTTVNKRQERWLKLKQDQKGILVADLEATHMLLEEARIHVRTAEMHLQQAKIETAVEADRAIQIDLALTCVRRQFDMQCASYEDILSTVRRGYEHYLLMLSLRRDKAIQATVYIAEQSTQTLVPQRNPATERIRMATQVMPSANPFSVACDSIIEQIHNTNRGLLPDVLSEPPTSFPLEEALTTPRQIVASRPGRASPPPASHGHAKRSRLGNVKQHEKQCLQHKGRRQVPDSAPSPSLPAIDDHQPRIIRHVNEFGRYHDVLVSPGYPPFFNSRKPQRPAREESVDERSDSPRAHASKQKRGKLPRNGDGALRYHRGFLQTGMEVLRGSRAQDDRSSEDEDDDSDQGGLHSPRGRLEMALRGHHTEQEQQQRSVRRPYRSPAKDSEIRKVHGPDDDSDQDDEDDDVDEELAQEIRGSRFIPGVLYPLIPHQ